MKNKQNNVIAIGETVHYYFLSASDGSGHFGALNMYKQNSSEVLLNNGKKIILDDGELSSVSLFEGYGVSLEKPSLHLRICDSSYGNSIDFMLYTQKFLTNDELKLLIEKEIRNKLKVVSEFNFDMIDKAIGGSV